MDNFFKTIGFKLLFIAALFTVFVSFKAHAAEIDEPDDDLYHLVKARPEFQKEINDLLAASGVSTTIYEMRVKSVEGITFGKTTIGISQGLIEASIRKTGNVSAAVAVVAHEIGHLKSSVFANTPGAANRNEERRADYYGQKLMFKNGKGCEATIAAFEILLDYNIGLREGPTHPATSERLQSAKTNCDSLNRTGKMPTNLYLE